jgi:hypothetical protein
MSVIILGNGFDLHCGLPSAYPDYYSIEKSTNNSYSSFAVGLERFRKNDYREANLMNTKGFPYFSGDFTPWDALFILVMDVFGGEEVNWFDIETIMSKSLREDSGRVENYFHWSNVLQYLRMHLSMPSEVIKPDNNLLFEDIIAWLLLLTAANNPDYASIADRSNIKTPSFFYAFLLIELKKYETRFGIYLKGVSSKGDYSEKASLFERKLRSLAATTGYAENNIIVSFNFTTFTGYALDFHHIHGCFKDNDSIFGIDKGGEQIYDFTKSARRNALAEIHEDDTKCPDFGRNVLVYGHSLCSQDQSFFFRMLDEMKVLESHDTDGGKPHITFAYSAYGGQDASVRGEELRKRVEKLLNDYGKKKAFDENVFEILRDRGILLFKEARD